MKAIQELRLLVNSELERMKHLLTERRNMLLAGAARDPVGTGVSQKVKCQGIKLLAFFVKYLPQKSRKHGVRLECTAQ